MGGGIVKTEIESVGKRQRRRCISRQCFAYIFWITITTTALLSEWKQICFPAHNKPHVGAATTI